MENKVLELVKQIPKGKVTTYKILAEKLNSKGYRNIGGILRNNKTPIITPCHRVVCSDGTLGGYKGKLDNIEKIKLLRKEGVIIKNNKIDLKKFLFRF